MEWVVQAHVDGRNNDNNKDKSKQRQAVWDLHNDVNNYARLLLQKSNLSFLLWLGNQFQPMKRKSGRQSSKDILSIVVWSLLRKTITGCNTGILGAYPNGAIEVDDAGDANGVTALAKHYGNGCWSN